MTTIKGIHVPVNCQILNTETELVTFAELICASFVSFLILHPGQQHIYLDSFPSVPSFEQTRSRDEVLKPSGNGRLSRSPPWGLRGSNAVSPSSGAQRSAVQPSPLM